MITINARINDKFDATIVEFGEGDVAMLAQQVNGMRSLIFKNVEKGEVGRVVKLDKDTNKIAPELIFQFATPESVDVLIYNLVAMKLAKFDPCAPETK